MNNNNIKTTCIEFTNWLISNKEYFNGLWYDIEDSNGKDVLDSVTPYFGQTTEQLFNIFINRNI